MIADLKPYAGYKESGIAWAPSLPATWRTERAKWLFTKMARPVRPEDEVVTCFRDGTVTLRKNRRVRGFTEATVEHGYQGIRRGDLVIHGMDAFAGAIGVSDSDGKGTPVYNVCQPRPGVSARFYAHAVREMSQSQWILALAKGIRERSTDFRYEMFGNQRLPLPPLDEQAAIVRFLDWANGRLERATRAKRKVITLLNEQKQAIIHRAVTRGLDPSVPLKATGSRWFPELPAHWGALTLRRVLSSAINGPHFSPQYHDARLPFLSARNVKADRWVLGDAKFISEDDYAEFSRRVRPEIGDVLYTKGGTTGIARAVDLAFRFQVWVHIAVLKLQRHRVVPAFLAYCLNSPLCYEQSQLFTRGATNQDLGLGRMKEIELPVPRTLEEQQSIVENLDEQTSSFTRAISRLEREIELLREYRIRLVADVVTGKLDVREAAARLPYDAPFDTAEDDADLSDETETADEEVAE